MPTEAQKAKIISAIASRGWFTTEIYQLAASELRAAGSIKLGERFSVGGNRKLVWVAA